MSLTSEDQAKMVKLLEVGILLNRQLVEEMDEHFASIPEGILLKLAAEGWEIQVQRIVQHWTQQEGK